MVLRTVGIVLLIAGMALAACVPESGVQTASIENPASPTAQSSIPADPTATPVLTQEIRVTPTTIFKPTTETQEKPEPEGGELPEITGVMIPVDGIDVAGDFYAPQGQPAPWPGVILLHMLAGNRSQWDEFPEELTSRGYGVLAVDLRGHGETGGEVDWELAVADLQQVWDYLAAKPTIIPEQTAFIGASIGANLALIAGSNEDAIQTVVLLSPGLSYAGVETEAAMGSFGERPVLIVASQEDAYAADSSSVLNEIAPSGSKLILYQSAGHGTQMFNAEQDLSQTILDWLDEHLQ